MPGGLALPARACGLHAAAPSLAMDARHGELQRWAHGAKGTI